MKLTNYLLKATLTGTLAILMSSTYAFAQTPADNQHTHDLTSKVRHELLMLPYFTIFDNLGYRVDGSTVTLVGKVTKPSIKQEAERVVEHIEGVDRVQNDIEVLPLSPFDNQIRWQEARAIYGYPTLNRYGMGTQPSIRIIVENGHVTLEGVVNNQADKNVAGMRANGVPGVFSVTNDLVVHS
jgi:hyperosmotically inducible periplasmic protein